MNRNQAIKVAENTIAIFENGKYQLLDGTKVSVKKLLNQAVKGTVDYPDFDMVVANSDVYHNSEYEVVNLPAIDVAINSEKPATILNFASAKNPGGGFLQGALAQEESLARSSGLYFCLQDSPMYDFHKEQKDPIYSDWIIYSPKVPVITNNEGQLLPEPIQVNFITCAAPNAAVLKQRNDTRDLSKFLEQRIDKVLSVARYHDATHLILGAWGCGVFGNDPKLVSQLFHKLLTSKFDGTFEKVTFAILDSTEEQVFSKPFTDLF